MFVIILLLMYNVDGTFGMLSNFSVNLDKFFFDFIMIVNIGSNLVFVDNLN